MNTNDKAAINTDIELYRENLNDPMDPGNAYAPRVFVTKEGEIDMSVGGSVIVMPIRQWQLMAQPINLGWDGFLTHSKNYMSYETRTPLQRLHFWIRYPFVYMRFKWFQRMDKKR